jgi:hypothetical protein
VSVSNTLVRIALRCRRMQMDRGSRTGDTTTTTAVFLSLFSLYLSLSVTAATGTVDGMCWHWDWAAPTLQQPPKIER